MKTATNKTATQLAIDAGIHSLNHLRIVEIVVKHGPENMTRLSELSGMTTAAMTGAIDALEALALVERIAVPGDRRKSNIEATWQGKELVRLMRVSNQAAYAAADLEQAAASV